jgi:hypothetical protein
MTPHEAVGDSLCPRPSYRSQGWAVFVQPEGKRYARDDTETGASLVTEAHVTDPGVAEQLEDYFAMIRLLLPKRMSTFRRPRA